MTTSLRVWLALSFPFWFPCPEMFESNVYLDQQAHGEQHRVHLKQLRWWIPNNPTVSIDRYIGNVFFYIYFAMRNTAAHNELEK